MVVSSKTYKNGWNWWNWWHFRNLELIYQPQFILFLVILIWNWPINDQKRNLWIHYVTQSEFEYERIGSCFIEPDSLGVHLLKTPKMCSFVLLVLLKVIFEHQIWIFVQRNVKKSGVLMFQIRKFWKNWSSTSNFKEKFQYKLVPSSESVLDIIHSDVA